MTKKFPIPTNQSQQTRDLFINLFGNNNNEMWNYFSSIIIKHTIIHSTINEKNQIKKFIQHNDQESINRIIEQKLYMIIDDVNLEIRTNLHKK